MTQDIGTKMMIYKDIFTANQRAWLKRIESCFKLSGFHMIEIIIVQRQYFLDT